MSNITLTFVLLRKRHVEPERSRERKNRERWQGKHKGDEVRRMNLQMNAKDCICLKSQRKT